MAAAGAAAGLALAGAVRLATPAALPVALVPAGAFATPAALPVGRALERSAPPGTASVDPTRRAAAAARAGDGRDRSGTPADEVGRLFAKRDRGAGDSAR